MGGYSVIPTSCTVPCGKRPTKGPLLDARAAGLPPGWDTAAACSAFAPGAAICHGASACQPQIKSIKPATAATRGGNECLVVRVHKQSVGCVKRTAFTGKAAMAPLGSKLEGGSATATPTWCHRCVSRTVRKIECAGLTPPGKASPNLLPGRDLMTSAVVYPLPSGSSASTRRSRLKIRDFAL